MKPLLLSLVFLVGCGRPQDGRDGINGLNGTNGVNGNDGVNGQNGKDGAPGINENFVLICHVPGGNNGKRHSIVVPQSFLTTAAATYDYTGECK